MGAGDAALGCRTAGMGQARGVPDQSNCRPAGLGDETRGPAGCACVSQEEAHRRSRRHLLSCRCTCPQISGTRGLGAAQPAMLHSLVCLKSSTGTRWAVLQQGSQLGLKTRTLLRAKPSLQRRVAKQTPSRAALRHPQHATAEALTCQTWPHYTKERPRGAYRWQRIWQPPSLRWILLMC